MGAQLPAGQPCLVTPRPRKPQVHLHLLSVRPPHQLSTQWLPDKPPSRARELRTSAPSRARLQLRLPPKGIPVGLLAWEVSGWSPCLKQQLPFPAALLPPFGHPSAPFMLAANASLKPLPQSAAAGGEGLVLGWVIDLVLFSLAQLWALPLHLFTSRLRHYHSHIRTIILCLSGLQQTWSRL